MSTKDGLRQATLHNYGNCKAKIMVCSLYKGQEESSRQIQDKERRTEKGKADHFLQVRQAQEVADQE
jgi:hypothetical protein